MEMQQNVNTITEAMVHFLEDEDQVRFDSKLEPIAIAVQDRLYFETFCEYIMKACFQSDDQANLRKAIATMFDNIQKNVDEAVYKLFVLQIHSDSDHLDSIPY